MAASLTGLVDDLHAALRASNWSEVIALYEREATREEKQQPEFRLPYAIALIRSGREASGMKRLTSDVYDLPNARVDLRRHVLPHLMGANSIENAATIAADLVEASPDSIEDLRLAGSLFGRLRRRSEALGYARRVIELDPDDLAGHTSYLMLLLQDGQLDEAGAHALAIEDRVEDHPKLASIVLLALTRSEHFAEAAQIAETFDESAVADDALAAAIVRALVETGRWQQAIDAGERLLRDGWDSGPLRSNIGRAYMESRRDDRYERVVEHFREGLAQDPGDLRMNIGIGEAMLRTRLYAEAIPHLAKACEMQPDAAYPRTLYARALKQAGRYAEAATEFRRLLELQPSSPRWHRYAAGALSQAGYRTEAAKLFDAFVASRATALPRSFERGLEQLREKVDEVEIPQARLDWAWSLSNARPNDRDEWERRAKWGHLADHYLLDWLECRDDRAHEAMLRLADLGEAERVLSAVDRSKGVILASAHIGPMYAGPLALELLGVQSRWLASTPSVARTAYAGSLISTSDQDDVEVAQAFMRALRQGNAVVVAVDGAINLAAPRIAFEGQEITYSSFAARVAHRHGIPSLFCAPRWEGDRIGFVLERMPDADEGEDADSHAERWRQAYLGALRNYLGGAPENLRLSGGIWRHIR